ncbi:hypothetical protein [Nonomuraea sp. NPDC048916]
MTAREQARLPRMPTGLVAFTVTFDRTAPGLAVDGRNTITARHGV